MRRMSRADQLDSAGQFVMLQIQNIINIRFSFSFSFYVFRDEMRPKDHLLSKENLTDTHHYVVMLGHLTKVNRSIPARFSKQQ